MLEKLHGVSQEEARTRFLALSCENSSFVRLAAKILEKPDIIRQIKDFVDPTKTYMHTFSSLNVERTLAVELGIPLHSPDEHFQYLDLKQECKEFLQEIGVGIVRGTPLARSPE